MKLLTPAWSQSMRGSLEQGGSVSTVSNIGGTGDGEADVFFGEFHDCDDKNRFCLNLEFRVFLLML